MALFDLRATRNPKPRPKVNRRKPHTGSIKSLNQIKSLATAALASCMLLSQYRQQSKVILAKEKE